MIIQIMYEYERCLARQVSIYDTIWNIQRGQGTSLVSCINLTRNRIKRIEKNNEK